MGLAGVSLPDVCPQTLNISEMRENSLSVSASLSVSLSHTVFPIALVADMPKLVIYDLDLERKHVHLASISDTQIHAPKHK